MPRPDRTQGRQAQRPQKGGRQEQMSMQKVASDTKALVSTINILTQKISLIERNEKILGRNVIVLNKKLKVLKEQRSSEALPENVRLAIQEIEKTVADTEEKMNDVRGRVLELKKDFMTKEEFKELKYVIDSINPLEFATIDQVKEMIAKATGKKMKEE